MQRYITKSNLRALQTATATHWQEMGYNRGKENSNSKHYSVAIGHQKEELENLKNQIQKQKKLIKSQEITSTEKKIELNKLDIILKETRGKIKKLKDCSELDNKISEDIDDLIKKSKILFLLDESKLRFNLKDKLEEYSQSRFKSQKEEIATNHVKALKKENEELKGDYNNLIDQYKLVVDENDDFFEKINSLTKELNNTLEKYDSVKNEKKELIKELEKVYNFDYKEFKSNLKKSNKNEQRYKNK